jgi:hypothetical protein
MRLRCPAATTWSIPKVFLVAAFAALAAAADLRPATVDQWTEYVRAADGRHAERIAQGAFLESELSEQTKKLHCGAIFVRPAGPNVPLRVESGLIHDWIGAAFIANTTLDEVMRVARDYDRYKNFYRPVVVDSRLIASSEWQDRFAMLLMNKSVVAKTAIQADYESSYTRLDEHRWYSVTDATRIQEIADYNTPSQHTLPENSGSGFLWRLHSITRFEERDGGVYIEIEAIALSRDIPAALRWFVEPIVRRVSRSSITTSLQQTQAAVRSRSAGEMLTSPQARCNAGHSNVIPVAHYR